MSEVLVSAAQPTVHPKISARQIGGVPDIHQVQLVPIQTTDGAEIHVNPQQLHVGILVSNDAFITFNAIPVPQMRFASVAVTVEFDELGNAGDPETLCVLHMRYLDRTGRIHEQYTGSLVADGGIFKFFIPAHQIKTGYSLPIAIRVTLMSETEGGNKRPVLIRAAWLEFPEPQ